MYFLLILLSIVSAEGSQEHKYIDLLPEKEKNEFLERVARRILAEVKTEENQAKSGEVSNQELDIHDAYVKSVIKEEKELKNKEDEAKVEVKRLRVEETGSPKQSKEIKQTVDDNAENTLDIVDLTKRSRNKRNDSSREIFDMLNNKSAKAVSKLSKEANNAQTEEYNYKTVKNLKGAAIDKVENLVRSDATENRDEIVDLTLRARDKREDGSRKSFYGDSNENDAPVFKLTREADGSSYERDIQVKDFRRHSNNTLVIKKIENDTLTEVITKKEDIYGNSLKIDHPIGNEEKYEKMVKTYEKVNMKSEYPAETTNKTRKVDENINVNVEINDKEPGKQPVGSIISEEEPILNDDIPKNNNKREIEYNIDKMGDNKTADHEGNFTIRDLKNSSNEEKVSLKIDNDMKHKENIEIQELDLNTNITNNENYSHKQNTLNITKKVIENITNATETSETKSKKGDSKELENSDKRFEVQSLTTESIPLSRSDNNTVTKIDSESPVTSKDLIHVLENKDQNVDSIVVKSVTTERALTNSKPNENDPLTLIRRGENEKSDFNKSTTSGSVASATTTNRNESKELNKVVKDRKSTSKTAIRTQTSSVTFSTIYNLFNVVPHTIQSTNDSQSSKKNYKVTDAISETTKKSDKTEESTVRNSESIKNSNIFKDIERQVTPENISRTDIITGNNKKSATKNVFKDLYSTYGVDYLKAKLKPTTESVIQIPKPSTIGFDFHVTNISSEIIDSLRNALNRKVIETILKFDGPKHFGKQHNVYEIPSNQPAFTKTKQNLNIEQPYYAPIYKYSPNNAYYNPENRLGPTLEDLKEHNSFTNERHKSQSQVIDFDYYFEKASKLKGNKKFRFGFGKDKHQPSSLAYKLPFPLIVRYPQDLHAPNNYKNIKVGRCKSCDSKAQDVQRSSRYNEKEGTESEEIDPNIPNIPLKDEIRNYREMINEKKFGPATFNPHERDETSSNVHKNFLTNNNNKRSKKPDNIAVDYYFSRSNTDENNKIRLDKLLMTIQNSLAHSYDKEKLLQSFLEHFHQNIHKSKETEDKNDVVSEADSLLLPKEGLKMDFGKRNPRNDIQLFVDVINDFIKMDNTALQNYDWLGTTVNIQGGILKLKELTQLMKRNKFINPSDVEVLKYIVHLYKKVVKKQTRSSLPKNRKKKKHNIIKEKGLVNRVWLIRVLANGEEELTVGNLDDFEQFLEKLQSKLYDLHTAIKAIAGITRFHHQNWFSNLKDLYLNSGQKGLEILLHISMSRFLDLLENSAAYGVENGYKNYMKNNEKEVDRTELEMRFLIEMLKELDK